MALATSLRLIRNNRTVGLISAALLIALAVFLRMKSPITLSYVTFYPAVILATVAGRWKLGLLAMVFSTLSAIYFFIPPVGSFALTRSDFWNAAAFGFVCLLIIALIELLVDLLVNTHQKAASLDVMYQRLTQSEQQQHILMHELSHRMKNQYSVILAMARAKPDPGTSVAEFQANLADRIISMGRAQDLLTQTKWDAVPLLELVNAATKPLAQLGRIEIQGEDVQLKEFAVVNVAMALHELGTNSSKYGAWSASGGMVIISWSLSQADFILKWEERDGPNVSASERQGFGRTILEKIVPAALQGTAVLEFLPEGLTWTLTAPRTCLL